MSPPADHVAIRREPLDPAAIARRVGHPTCGAVATFSGVVRNHNEGRDVRMVRYEAYESMAARRLAAIAAELRQRFGVTAVAIEHRLGDLEVGETSVVMAVSSPHRKEAFEAIREGMETLKHTVPIFKQEFYLDGSSEWVGCGDDRRPRGPAAS